MKYEDFMVPFCANKHAQTSWYCECSYKLHGLSNALVTIAQTALKFHPFIEVYIPRCQSVFFILKFN